MYQYSAILTVFPFLKILENKLIRGFVFITIANRFFCSFHFDMTQKVHSMDQLLKIFAFISLD